MAEILYSNQLKSDQEDEVKQQLKWWLLAPNGDSSASAENDFGWLLSTSRPLCVSRSSVSRNYLYYIIVFKLYNF